MSLRLIELQLALPKTQDAGKIQNELYQKSNVDQSFLTSQMKQKEIEKRKKTEKLNKSELKEHNTTKSPNSQKSRDPNKGRFIDLEL